MINSNNVNLLYRYIRGSHLYGLNVPTSDIDYGAVFMDNPIGYLGTHIGYKDYMADEKGDEAWYEVVKWVNGLLTSNPTMLESLFVPNDKIVYNNGLLQPFFENKHLFLTKECYKPMFYYAKNQIEKAQGLNKKCMNPMTHRKTIFDFCYVPYNQGSIKVLTWLEQLGLKQEYCGLVNIPNMNGVYSLFYDWGAHFKNEGITFDDLATKEDYSNLRAFLFKNLCNNLKDWFDAQINIERKYKGIASTHVDAQEVRLSSILKEEVPITVMQYNKNAYSQHCSKYREYKIWEKERNEARYESNLGTTYDGKNMLHCFRTMAMCEEILQGNGLILDRREVGDVQFLLDVRNHKFEYEELMALAKEKTTRIKQIYEESKIPEKLDKEFINNLLIDIQLKEIKKIY